MQAITDIPVSVFKTTNQVLDATDKINETAKSHAQNC